ncbi:MAG: transposase [Pseudomonadota bacterium]
MFDDIDTDLNARRDVRTGELEGRIGATTSSDAAPAETSGILRSIAGVGPVASTTLIAEMPELGAVNGAQAASLAGLAPVAHESGTLRRKRALAVGRRALRHGTFQATLVASHPGPRIFAARLRKAGKPHRVIVTTVARNS